MMEGTMDKDAGLPLFVRLGAFGLALLALFLAMRFY